MGSKEIKLDFKDTCYNLIKEKPLKTEDIIQRRKYIKESIEVFVRDKITLDNFNTLLDSRALLYLFSLYDKTFFENKLLKILESNGCVIQICFDNMCTRTAGKCFYKNRCKRMVIKLATKVFKKALKNDKIRLNAGIPCKGLLECLLLTFEHEFIHAFIGCFCYEYGHSSIIQDLKPDSKKILFDGEFKDSNGHSKVFMTIVNNKFGHTKYTHNLFKHDELPKEYRYLTEKMSVPEIKKHLKTTSFVKFNAGERGIIEGVIGGRLNAKKVKVVEIRNGRKYDWNVPYGLLIEIKSDTSNSNNNVPLKILKKKSSSKNSGKPAKPKSNSSNNNKPLVLPPKRKVSNTSKKSSPKPKSKTKKLIFKVKKTIKNLTTHNDFTGPHKDKYLMGIPKEYREKYGKEKITNLDTAKRISKELGNKSGGITKGKKYFSVRAGKILQDSTTGEISWLKK